MFVSSLLPLVSAWMNLGRKGVGDMELLTTKTILWIIVMQICFFLGTICIFQIQMAELKQIMKEFREEYKTRKTEKSDD